MMRTRERRGGTLIENGISKAPEGCGTELKKLLKRFRIAEKAGCHCNKMAQKMDKEGAQWCRENIEEIVNVMEKEATRRKWPFVRMLAREITKTAIRIYERKIASPREQPHASAT